MGFQEDVRGAAVSTLEAYATAASLAPFNVTSARPRLITPPHAFVDALRENIEYSGHLMQRKVQCDVVIAWGGFDSEDAGAQKDAFVDGYIDYVRTSGFHAAGADTTLGVISTEDDPTFTPEWLPRDQARTYYATRLTLEGYAET